MRKYWPAVPAAKVDGVAPAPPPIINWLTVNAAEDANVPVAVYPRMPPEVPEVKPVPPWFTAIVVAFHVPVVMVPTETNALSVVNVALVVADKTVALCVPVISPASDPVKLPAVAALRFATCVVDETTNGAVPVATEEIS